MILNQLNDTETESLIETIAKFIWNDIKNPRSVALQLIYELEKGGFEVICRGAERIHPCGCLYYSHKNPKPKERKKEEK